MTSSQARPFGAVLRQHRIAAGLSQRAVASRAGLSERAVRDLECGGTSRPRPQSVRSLARALALSGDALSGFFVAAHADDRSECPAAVVAAPDEFVGRLADLRKALDMVLGRRHRLITVIGPGGVGKSRLAAELVAVLRRAEHDVRTLDLSTVADHRLVAEQVAEVVGGGVPARGPAVEHARIHVGDRRLILLLDGVERLVAAGPDLGDLVRYCPGLTIVSTSQRRLNVHGERLLPLEPLPPPEAAELFARRAAAVAPMAARDLNPAVVTSICDAVDHLPLAVELAAAELRLLAADELLARLGRPLDVLTGGAANLPARHRSLRSTIAVGVQAAGEGAQTVFAWLGAFAAGIRADDLDRLLPRLTDHPQTERDGLGDLADAGLVRVRRRGPVSRYVMADPVRELAREALARRADRDAVARFAAEIHLDRLRAAAAQPDGAGFADLDPDADNVRDALVWAGRQLPQTVDQPTVEAMYRYCEQRGRFVEGRRTLLALADAGVAGAAWALVAAGTLSRMLKDTTTARELAVRARRALPPGDHGAESALAMLEGSLAAEVGDLIAARTCMERAHDTAVAAQDWAAARRALHNLGSVLELTGDLARAEQTYRNALEARRRAGARDNDLALTLMNLANVSLGVRNWAMAVAHAEEAAELFRRGGHSRFRAFALTTLAIAALGGGAAGQRGRDAARRAIDAAVKLLDAFGDETPHRGLIEARASIVRHACGDTADVPGQLRRGLTAMTHGLTSYEIPAVLDAHADLAVGRDPVAAARLLGLAAAVRRTQPHSQPALLRDPAEVRADCRARLGGGADDEYAHGDARLAHGVASAASALLTGAVASWATDPCTAMRYL